MGDLQELAADLAQMRRRGQQRPTATFAIPPDLVSAAAVQSALVAIEGGHHEALKLVRCPTGEVVAGPMYPLLPEGAGVAWVGNLRVEVEIALRLARDIPPRPEGYDADSLRDAVASLWLGVEFVAGAMAEGSKASYELFMADRLGNHAYVLGPALPAAMLDAFDGLPVSISLDGKSLYEGAARNKAGGLLNWLALHASQVGMLRVPLTKGLLITTGSLCGPVPLPRDTDAAGNLRLGLGDFSVDCLLQADRSGGE